MGGNRSYKDFAALPLFYLMAVPEVQNLRCVAPITFVAEKMRLKSKVQRTEILFSCSLFNILYSSFSLSLLTVYCSLLSYQKVQSSLFTVYFFTVYHLLLTSHLSPLSSLFREMSAGQRGFFFFNPQSDVVRSFAR